ncbi:MAG: hypothetical protein AAGI01_03525 [Myxococcota bacterium]
MSLSYRVSLQVQEVVSADDKTVHKLDLHDVLPEEEMKDLLRESLEQRGFEQGEEEHTMVRQGDGGETITVNLDTMEVTTELEAESEVRGKVDAWGDAETRAGARRQAESSARSQADQMVERGQKEVQRRVTQQLAEGEADRLEQMNEVLQDVYSEALKRKARRMGDVVEQAEGTNENGEYELVIKVEV